MNALVSLGGELGYVFVGEISGAYCFVLRDCVEVSADGRIKVDLVRYFLSGWSLRNQRWSDHAASGSHIFPDASRPVVDVASPPVQQFLRRLPVASARTAPAG